MASSFKIITAHEFLEVTADGIIDIAASRRLFSDIAEIDRNMGDRELLVDFRGTESELSITDVHHLASELVQHGTSFRRKVALVVTTGPDFNRASFFETCSRNRGYSVKVYTDYEAAIRWILTAQQPDIPLPPVPATCRTSVIYNRYA